MLKNPLEELRCALESSALQQEAKAIVNWHLPIADLDSDHDQAELSGPLYISSVSAEGFRGVGPRTTIDLRAGKGLTLIVGGNGTGKSSMAEAAERVLTGTTIRWESSEADAKENWANVHHDGEISIGATLYQSDNPLPIELEHRWLDGDGFLQGTQSATFGGIEIQRRIVGDLRDDLRSYPPILPYAELEAVLSGKPAYLFDAFVRIVGLGEVDQIREKISTALYEGGNLLKTASSAQTKATSAIKSLEDNRTAGLTDLISEGNTDLLGTMLDSLGSRPTDDKVAAILTLPALDLESLSRTANELGRLVTQLLNDHESGQQEAWAKLLEQAILLFDTSEHDQIQCPICDQASLGAEWRQNAAAQLAVRRLATTKRSELRNQITDLRQRLLSVLAPLQDLAAPDQLPGVSDLTAIANTAVNEVRTSNDIHQLGQLLSATANTFEAIRSEAESIRESDQNRLKPAIEACREWIVAEQLCCDFRNSKRDLESARDWVAVEIDRQREYRMTALSTEASRIWQTLSPGDSLEIEPMQLLGSKSKRKLDLNCQTEGQSAKARSILSVGQMHALALSLFIPRATHADSPFGFLLIDDPIHALDGIRIDGLAQILHEIAKEKQVVVCTHDRRLEAALETLGLPADILRLERSTGSAVQVASEENEILQRLDDADSLSSDPNIARTTRLIAVAGCCRTAVEGAAARHFRRTAMASGRSVDDIEAELDQVGDKLWDKVELAVYGTATNRRDTASRIESDYSKGLRELLSVLNSSGHEAPSDCKPGKLPGRTRRAISQLFPSVIS